MNKICKTNSSERTQALGEALGKNLKGGEVIELTSDVGGGKTTFVRGLAKGAGSETHVSSPTFKISNTYKTPKFEIVHFDFYRLHEAGLIEHELADYLDEFRIVVVIEWSDVVEHALPSERLKVHIKNIGDEQREFEFTYPDSLKYLLDNVDTHA